MNEFSGLEEASGLLRWFLIGRVWILRPVWSVFVDGVVPDIMDFLLLLGRCFLAKDLIVFWFIITKKLSV